MLPMRTTPPFRADHVGSLLRPARVLTARADYATGHISAEPAVRPAPPGRPVPTRYRRFVR